jgi:hypothetical protein
MKAITLYEPWATLVAIGVKPHETRSWPTSYRGPLAIHAGKSRDYLGLAESAGPIRAALRAAGYKDAGFFALGCVVCTCVLDTCTPVELVTPNAFGDYTAGRFAWSLTKVQRLSVPVPARGFQQLWEWTPDGGANTRPGAIEGGTQQLLF